MNMRTSCYSLVGSWGGGGRMDAPLVTEQRMCMIHRNIGVKSFAHLKLRECLDYTASSDRADHAYQLISFARKAARAH